MIDDGCWRRTIGVSSSWETWNEEWCEEWVYLVTSPLMSLPSPLLSDQANRWIEHLWDCSLVTKHCTSLNHLASSFQKHDLPETEFCCDVAVFWRPRWSFTDQQSLRRMIEWLNRLSPLFVHFYFNASLTAVHELIISCFGSLWNSCRSASLTSHHGNIAGIWWHSTEHVGRISYNPKGFGWFYCEMNMLITVGHMFEADIKEFCWTEYTTSWFISILSSHTKLRGNLHSILTRGNCTEAKRNFDVWLFKFSVHSISFARLALPVESHIARGSWWHHSIFHHSCLPKQMLLSKGECCHDIWFWDAADAGLHRTEHILQRWMQSHSLGVSSNQQEPAV